MLPLPEFSSGVEDVSPSNTCLPDVFIIPPEEEYDNPPYCCFDAKRDAHPGEFIADEYMMYGDPNFVSGIPSDSSFYDDEDADVDMELVDDGEDGEDMILSGAKRARVRHEDVFAMKSLVQEAENIRARLKALDLTVQPRPRVDSLPESVDESLDIDMELSGVSAGSSSATPAQSANGPSTKGVRKSKSFFSFARKKSHTDFISANARKVEPVDSDGTSVCSTRSNVSTVSRKSGIFSRFKLSKKSSYSKVDPSLQDTISPSVDIPHAEEPEPTEQQGVTAKCRFSIFGTPRRSSMSSESTPAAAVPTTPSIVSDRSETLSSVSSSVPATPDASPSDLGSPTRYPLAVQEASSFPVIDEPASLTRSSIFASIDTFGVNDFASSLTFPLVDKQGSSNSSSDSNAFSLDPLHFESLQFDSDAFP